jgi:hypothetical protein
MASTFKKTPDSIVVRKPKLFTRKPGPGVEIWAMPKQWYGIGSMQSFRMEEPLH